MSGFQKYDGILSEGCCHGGHPAMLLSRQFPLVFAQGCMKWTEHANHHTHFTSTVFLLGLGRKKFGVSKSAVKRHIDHSKSPGTWHVHGNKFMVLKVSAGVSASCFAQSAEMSLVFLAAKFDGYEFEETMLQHQLKPPWNSLGL
jgi:hypothetical protein